MKLETTFQLRMDQTSRSTFEAIAKKKKEAEIKADTEAYDKRKAKRKSILEAKRKALNETNPFDYAITFHDELNSKLFSGERLHSDIKKQLEMIAQDFLEYLGIGSLQVKDITISGSNAAYSYTKHSDLDLHILADLTKMQDPVYAELFAAKKTLYNEKHKITVKGIPVELYVQDATQTHVSLGEYSLLHNKWIKFPSKRRANFDQSATKAKYEKLTELIKYGLKTQSLTKIQNVLNTIKRYRQAGLDKGGEFGPENLAFKAVRTQGLVTKLFALRDRLYSEKLSTESMYENIPLDKPTPTVSQLASKHRLPREKIAAKLDAGIKIELEHTTDREVAKEIALDHLNEDPSYYEKLKKVDLEENLNLLEVTKEKPYKLPKLRADRDHLIYVIINNKTKQRYVGITAMAYAGDIHRSLNRRMQKHLQRARIENKSWGLCASLRKYGPDAFTYGLLEIVRGKKPAHSREIEIIGQHNPALNTAKAALKEVESGNYPTKHFTMLNESKSDNLPQTVFHVTPTKNLGKIAAEGLIPAAGGRSSKLPGEKNAIYCFPDVISLEDALMNWLGDQFDDSDELAILEIDTTGLTGKYTKHAEYEIAFTSPIPPSQIRVQTKVI